MNNAISRILLFLSIVAVYSMNAQTLQTEQLTISEGLSNSRVHNILQDSYGLLWVGSNDGLNLYDGYSFKIFKNVPGNSRSIQSNIVWALAEDRERNIWIATEIGVSKYIRAENAFQNYEFSELFSNLRDGDIRTLEVVIDDSNNVWAGTGGLDALKYNRITDRWEIQDIELIDSSATQGVAAVVIGMTLDNNNQLWAGSFRAGLIKYDWDQKIFRQVEISNRSEAPDLTQADNQITDIFVDPTGILWMTTRNGIYKYNPRTKHLKTIKEYTINKNSFWNYFSNIFQDQKGNIWITNNQRGILKFDGISDEYKQVTLYGQNFSRDGISNIVLTRGFKDRTGILWFGSITDGIIKYDPQRAPFRHYYYDAQLKDGISTSPIFGLFESKQRKGKILVGTRGGGLNLYEPNADSFNVIPYKVIKDNFGGSVRAIFEENDGTLWLGTWGDGLVQLNSSFKEVNRFVSDSANVNSLPDDQIRVIRQDSRGNLWIGANTGLAVLNSARTRMKRVVDRQSAVYSQEVIDLIRNKRNSDRLDWSLDKVGDFDDLTQEFKIIKPRNYLVVSTGEGRVADSLMYDYGWITDADDKEIWTAVHSNESFYLGGAEKNRIVIDVVQLKPGNYKLRYKSDDSHSFANWNAAPPSFIDLYGIRLFEIKDDHEFGMIQSHIKTARQQKYIKGRNIRSIHIDRNDIVWIGSDVQGLNRYDTNKQEIKVYANDPKNSKSLSDNSVQFIYEDDDGILWLATNNGLNRFDPDKETFQVFTEEDGLPTNYIASILPGDSGELWLATRNGISKMVTDQTGKVTFVNYDASDGLGGTDFIALVALKSSSGRYYFGGEHGLNAFMPGETNNTPPSLILSDLKISNTSVLSMKSDLSLDTSLYDLSHLELPYDKNDLSFEYSALHYSNPNKNQYAYMLQGYDQDWIYDNKRNTTYTNLDHGEYTFLFKGTNRDGVWNEQARSLQITILPPWWMTIWAYIGYGLLLIAAFVTVDRVQRRRLLSKAKERMRLQEAELRAETAELQAKAAEAERRALEAENARKSRELEEARELQLSMLPKNLPELPNLDIAVYMKTATEVGGDYYDFHVSLDGTLTVVIGDATGHGMKAGTMVTTAKSLFNSYAPNPDILFSFQEITRCIKQMNFEKLSMCMTMLKIQGNKMIMSSAGMPPSFIFRRETRVVEEHLMQGMPLGTMEKFPYKIEDTRLKSGDTILLLTDGFPELQNDKDKQYGYKQVRNVFEEIAEKEPEEIITHLRNEGSAWVNDQDPDDDVTFVVLKVK